MRDARACGRAGQGCALSSVARPRITMSIADQRGNGMNRRVALHNGINRGWSDSVLATRPHEGVDTP